ncbi:hypothetical protein [Streptomyces sp. NPDC048106]
MAQFRCETERRPGPGGLLVRADDGTAVLADVVRYSLRLTDADDVSTY